MAPLGPLLQHGVLVVSHCEQALGAEAEAAAFEAWPPAAAVASACISSIREFQFAPVLALFVVWGQMRAKASAVRWSDGPARKP